MTSMVFVVMEVLILVWSGDLIGARTPRCAGVTVHTYSMDVEGELGGVMSTVILESWRFGDPMYCWFRAEDGSAMPLPERLLLPSKENLNSLPSLMARLAANTRLDELPPDPALKLRQAPIWDELRRAGLLPLVDVAGTTPW